MDFIFFHYDQDFVVERFRAGDFDYVDAVSEVEEIRFFRYIGAHKILPKSAASYPSPRKKEEVPTWMYLASNLTMRLHGVHSFHAYPPRERGIRMTSQEPESSLNSFKNRIGIFPPLFWGYVGLLLFMIGDGIEAGYLSKYLVDRQIASENMVAVIFTVYGITVAISAWLSGAFSDLCGPRKVMGLGLRIWVIFEVGFLLLGVAPGNYILLMLLYALRGFGYPLFAYGFLVWISVATPKHRLGTAVGWFWFALTGGLLTLDPQCSQRITRIKRIISGVRVFRWPYSEPGTVSSFAGAEKAWSFSC
jgi:hypothetical protein